MEFRILGPVEVTHDGKPVDVGPRKQRSLLALLLLNANRLLSTDRILDQLWGDEADDKRKALWTHISRLRAALEPDRRARGESEILVTKDQGYMLSVAPDSIDAYRFETEAIEGRSLVNSDPPKAAEILRDALALWRGTALQDFAYDDFAQSEIGRLEELRISALEDRIEADIASGVGTPVIGELEALAVEHPYRERITCLLMVALYGAERQAEALRAFSRLRMHLVEELGIEPSESARQLEQRILDQDPSVKEVSRSPDFAGLKTAGDFELHDVIGEGRFGVIYRAHQRSVNRQVAVKVVRPEYANNPEFLRRFEYEAQLVAKLEHPHIVPLYAFWRDPAGAYLAMRFFRGGSLRHALELGAWRPQRTVRLIEQLASAMDAAHRQGVLHRDIKPANVLLDNDGNAYLSDFGMAKFMDAALSTQSGATVATPAYMSPEQLGEGPPVPASDVYALGIVAYEALSGHHPYPTDSVAAMIKHQLNDPLPSLGTEIHQIEPAIDEVLARATAKDPADRFSDALEFAGELAAAIGMPARPSGIAPPTREASPVADPVLEDFVTEQTPFGPIAMDEIATRGVYRDLYSSDNQIHDEIVQRRPSFIVGRRGAGKTALMRVPLLDAANLLIEFKSSDLFAQVLACVDALERTGSRIFVQQISDIWDGVVWSGLCLAIAQLDGAAELPPGELHTIQRYVAGAGELSTLTVDEMGAAYCRMLAGVSTAQRDWSAVHEVGLGGVSLVEAREAGRRLLRLAELRPVVLIDSMEDLHLEVETLSRVLAGLFGLIGKSDRSPTQECDFRFCYPSELWSKLADFAANPLKDAENHIKLYWSAPQLIKIAGHRLSLFLRLYHPDHLTSVLGKKAYDPTSFDDARRVLQSVLPAAVPGATGDPEDTIAFVMRHTQLLPRHLLRILNGIMQRNLELGEPATAVTPAAVIDGVRRVEDLLVAEVFTAYGAVHQSARDACRRLIPELPLVFTDGLLHRTYNRTGIRKDTGLAYLEFKEMLVEIGCLGRVIGRTDRYVEGEFDYTLPTPLFPSSDDKLCLHPLFADVFHARRDSGTPEDPVRPVYPYGSDPDHVATW